MALELDIICISHSQRNLLLSILPKHTAEALEKDISEMIIRIKNERRSSPTLITSQPYVMNYSIRTEQAPTH